MAAQPQGEEWEEVLLSLVAGPDPGEGLEGLENLEGPERGAEGERNGESAGGERGEDDPDSDPESGERVPVLTVVPAMVSASPGPAEVARDALQGLGLSTDAASGWVDLLCAQVVADGAEEVGVPVPTGDAAVLDAMGAMARSSAALEASLLVSVQDLVLSTGSRLLAEREVTDPRTMSRTAHQTWRVNVKAVVAGELQVLLGVGVGEARRLVAIATYPGMIRRPILGALRRGEVVRRLVLAFQLATRRLEVEQTERVAAAMFGTEVDRAAVERLDVDGELELGRPWHHAEFYAALKREVTRAKAEDEDAAEDDRAAAHEARSAQMNIEDDGTATLVVTMATVTGAAVMGRIEDMARRARAGGDKRTLAQLRSDIIAILLLHGIVALPGDDVPTHEDARTDDDARTPEGGDAGRGGSGADGQAGFDEIVTPEDVLALRALINATPAGHVDLVIPWDAALGAVCPTCSGPMTRPAEGARPHGREGQGDECAHDPGEGEECAHDPTAGPDVTGPGQDDFETPHSGCPTHATCRREDPADPQGMVPPRVGELIGWESAFITPRQARQIILTPGSVVGRLLIDPADGRCLERSIKRYKPDAEMRRQVYAADVYGRGPGSRRPAQQSEIDHEKEFSTHGWTAETNLNAKELLNHYRKTKGHWRSVMNRRRDVTWTTLLGQVARTRCHDYRQYFDRVVEMTPLSGSDPDRPDLAARRDLLNQLVYAAIVHRRPGERTEADDDIPESEDWLGIGDWGHVSHTDEHGQRRRGGPPDQPAPEQILGLDQEVDPDSTDTADAAGERVQEVPEAGGRETPGTATPWGAEEHRRTEDEPPPF